jgi:diguanylate cyclase (GGDEF)-like protein
MALPPTAAARAHSFGGINHAAFSVVNQATGAVLASSVLPANRLARVRFEHLQSTGDWKGIDGSRRLFGSARVPGTNWRVYSGVPRSTVLADARDTLTREALLGILALLILALAAWALNRRVAAPLRAIARHVGAQMGAEPDESRIHESGTAEIAALARGFNAMLDVRAGHEAQLAYQASHDPLTGLPNRVALREQLAVALRDETRTGHTVMCVGIDRLDVINDSFGHDVGERLLAAVVTRLSNMVRPGDTLARFGGDEFVVVCGDLACGEETGLAEPLQACFEEPFAGPDGDVVIHASIGIAELGAAGSADELLRQADSAMREARRTGVAFSRFDRALQDRATRQVRVENDLRQAVKRDEFVVHYQPLLDLRSGRIVGAEALVRWSHPQRGVVPPIDFVPLAEQTGQIVQIGRLVLEKACHQAAAWRLSGQALRISVNAAVAQLRDRGFAADVARILDETGLPAEQLCLEITESSLLNAAGSGIAGIEALRRLGVRIAIDDFGTGYSSLAYLHQMPVDELKIDRSFVSRLERDERDRHLVVAILGMAHALDLSVVAEGVETDMQHELLRRFGCELAQGYLFSPPRSADEFAGLLEDRSARQAVSAAA